VDVYFVGRRHQAEGTAIRFQGPTYDAVYAALPDLLAALRSAQTINWKKTIEAIPKVERSEAITALVKAQGKGLQKQWQLAKRLALEVDKFKTAQIKWLGEERTRGVRIEVFEDEEAKKQLSAAVIPPQKPTVFVLGQGNQLAIVDGSHEGDLVSIGGSVTGSAIGRGASVTAEQITANINQNAEHSADLVAVVKQALEVIAGLKLAEPDQLEAMQIVEKITKEVAKPQAEADAARPARVKRWLDALAAICKPAAEVLSASKAVFATLSCEPR
jgi:hypothetical protein